MLHFVIVFGLSTTLPFVELNDAIVSKPATKMTRGKAKGIDLLYLEHSA